MSRGDGKNPKFRILCKRCNSYQHTVLIHDDDAGFQIRCTGCGNAAKNFKEEAE